MEKINTLLKHQEANHLFPFFWQHGESHEILLDYITKIYESGIHNLCIESRPHPAFLQDQWWEDLAFIIKEAKKRQMKLWILDDAKFPTGYANGQVPKHLQKQYLRVRRYDICGPVLQGELSIAPYAEFRQLMMDKEHQNDALYKVYIAKNDTSGQDAFIEDSLQDVTAQVEHGKLKIQLDADHYSIFVLYTTYCGQEVGTREYLDPTRKEATQILLNEVYEKHWSHFSQEFGQTIVGFFSDEPRFGNAKGANCIIGKTDMVIPWNMTIEEKLQQANICEVFLFTGVSKAANDARFYYMDIVSDLYAKNFSAVIGAWCTAHDVDYVGHVIEDNNAHARLGYGPGHYFRSLVGQTYAGIDIIGGQVIPGMDYAHTAFSTGGSDGEFYHYALCKLGQSAAKLDPKKKGRLMCEAFGAYGWVEGLRMMKWITNHMLVHGVNVIVPHAFSPKQFPDFDCPPHFYAHGNNPQFAYFTQWSTYTNRLCELLQDGHQQCEIGVLYHAFAEWQGKTMFVQKVTKTLQQNQIDCNIISEDYLIDATVQDGKYWIEQYGFHTLVVPYAPYLPKKLMNALEKLAKEVQIIWIHQAPAGLESIGKTCTLDQLAQELEKDKLAYTETPEKDLSMLHYMHRANSHVFVFNNESVTHTIDTQVKLPFAQELAIYDASTNEVYTLDAKYDETSVTFQLTLQPYEMLVLVSTTASKCKPSKGSFIQTLDMLSSLECKAYNESSYQRVQTLDALHSEAFARFSGNLLYTYDVQLVKQDHILEIAEANEVVELVVNGTSCGVQIAPPYRFVIPKDVIKQTNTLQLLITNTLVNSQNDGLSQYVAHNGLGILSDVCLYYVKETEK
ncbi:MULTISPECIES: hypothetical protein [unclassified Breznakia]|uniref:hypothetical protein n=1 Tax=unclassified Breznakia TaxID=2623764 RepID=UPI002473AC33|nr:MULTISPECIES: hypothetical protein [unclassified Breznakia]MDH6366882.1 hypothetical protein [Breznakia sp. PH1-1]MDH6404060.1 hypothetical protein [Breznakia sp. PF1-11]MDH6411718.1 hypothetical protein [Breznakia sp. PFB1-11]MDH6414048.1 hypothetical protein [Breznakia sp. PFB1-14]MDH6416478.1 hypothetical protein [Breznakia sp. PFB1-4]